MTAAPNHAWSTRASGWVYLYPAEGKVGVSYKASNGHCVRGEREQCAGWVFRYGSGAEYSAGVNAEVMTLTSVYDGGFVARLSVGMPDAGMFWYLLESPPYPNPGSWAERRVP